MHAEILAIGDEITSGQLLDTNSQWLSRRTEELGLRVLFHATVGDQLDAMADVIAAAIGRSDVIVLTGGLGPTADDLTRQAMARAAGRELEHDAAALEQIRRLFARLNRSMPEKNKVQALFPAGSRVIENPEGTAPGIAMEVDREGRGPCRLFALPGVPAEMRSMWHDSVAPALRAIVGEPRMVRHRIIKCFGAGESNIEAMLPDLIRRGRSPRVGINASRANILLRITAEGESEAACEARIAPTVQIIHRTLGDLVFGSGEDELQDAVVRLLAEQGKTLAVCEWGSAGMIDGWLGSAADAPGHFVGGLVVTGHEAVRSVLGLSAQESADDEEALVAAMARACRERFESDLALAVGPFPEVDPTATSPRQVHFALAEPEGTKAISADYAGHSALVKTLNAKRALNLVRLALIDTAGR